MTSEEMTVFLGMKVIMLILVLTGISLGITALCATGLLVMFGSWIYAGTRGINNTND